tara:strand:- start:260 stop:721 length:462 start_codon:yes stop_codon:yes gene_type:complete
MKTKHKILLVKIIFFLISIIKKKKLVRVQKNNINWELDLSEGIDLSVYIFGKFEYEIVTTIAKHKLSKNPVFFDIGTNVGVQTLQLKEKKVPIIFELAPYLYKEYGYTHYDLINLFKELGYKFYNIHNLTKIVNINKFILSIADGSSTVLIAK